MERAFRLPPLSSQNSQHVRRHDLQPDRHVRDAFVPSSPARRLRFDLRFHGLKIGEPPARAVQEFSPLGPIFIPALVTVHGRPGPDELQDERAPRADVRAARQEVAADLMKRREERGG